MNIHNYGEILCWPATRNVHIFVMSTESRKNMKENKFLAQGKVYLEGGRYALHHSQWSSYTIVQVFSHHIIPCSHAVVKINESLSW